MSDLHWWQDSVFYQVYMPSFCDGNGDGVGDFPGLISKLDYLQQLGVDGLWITPFYPSPMVDNGYDVSDYCGVDPRFGSLDDFDLLIEQTHKRGIKVLIDLVLNHVSSEHKWFQDALNNPASPYRDYFFFCDEPNNWQSFFGGSAWSRESEHGQYYYHKFSSGQIDLNWTNPKILEEARAVFDFWIGRGVDGFRLDVINFLSAAGIGEDNPSDENGGQQHRNDINQPGILDVLSTLSAHVKSKGDYFLVGEVGSDDLEELIRYQNSDVLDVVFNFNLGSLGHFDAAKLFGEIEKMHRQQAGLPTLFFSSHDMPRMISRFGEQERDIERAKAVAVLQLCAKGVPFIYNGEEIGMTDYIAGSLEDIRDVQGLTHYHQMLDAGESKPAALEVAIRESRDNSRSPMQWDNSRNGGFTSGNPWIPLNPNYHCVNVVRVTEQPEGIYQHYHRLLQLRKVHPALRRGQYQVLEMHDGLIHFQRQSEEERVSVYINFGDSRQMVTIPAQAEVLLGSSDGLIERNNFLIISL